MGGNAAEFVVTAGPTREYLDPVRFLSNPSTGRMGFAVAQAAARRGCRVTLVAGPVSLPTPRGVKRIDVTSAREMEKRAVEAVRIRLDCRGRGLAARQMRRDEIEERLFALDDPEARAQPRHT